MAIYLVKSMSVFVHVAIVHADSQKEADENFERADFFQKHMGEIILDTTIAEEGYEDKLRAEGYF